jgi:hypothetical protein
MNASSQLEDRFPDFPPVVVKTDRFDSIGTLFSANDRCVILANNVSGSGDYGPLRHFRDQHLTPECDVTILPKTIVREIFAIGVAHDSERTRPRIPFCHPRKG